MLTVEVKINGNLVAGAKIKNVSELADFSDYEAEIVEDSAPHLGTPAGHCLTRIEGHPRFQSVWVLVKEVADRYVKARGRPRTEQSLTTRWSFDDQHIGRLTKTGNALATRVIPRPVGLPKERWYAYAQDLCRNFNEREEVLPC